MINFIIGFLLLHYLTPTEMGIYGVPMDFMNMLVLGVLSLFTNTTQKFVSEYIGSGNSSALRGIIVFSFFYFSLSGLTLFVIFFLTNDKIAEFILKNELYSYPLKVYSLAIPFIALSTYLSSVLVGFSKFKEVSINDIMIPSFARLIFLILGLPIHPNKVLVAVLSQNFKYFINSISNLIAAFKILKDNLKIKGLMLDIKAWFIYGFPLWLKFWFSLVQTNIKPVLVGSIINVFSGGVFKAASLISSGVYLLETSVINVLFVEISRDIGAGNMLRASLRVRRITLYISLSMAAFTSASIILGTLILRIFGKGYEYGSGVLSLLILGYYFNSISGIWQAFVQAARRTDYVLIISVIYAFSEVSLTLLLIKPLGIVGAALSFPISAIIISILRFYLFQRVANIKPANVRTLIISGILGLGVCLVGYLAQGLFK